MTDKAKEIGANLFAKTKTGFSRTKQFALVKMGKADETIDISFNQDRERLLEHYKNVKKTRKDVKKLLELLKELSEAQAILEEDFSRMYDTHAPLYSATLKSQDSFKQVEESRIQMEEQLRADFFEPLSKYSGQFKEMKQRIELRHKRRIDMDRYSRDVKTLQEKAKNAKLPVAEEKYNVARHNYNALNEELMRDMPRLIDDRIPFFEPLFASYVMAVSDYYRQSAGFSQQPLSLLSGVDRAAIHSHPRVITLPEVSSAARSHTAQIQTSSPSVSHHASGSSSNVTSPGSSYANTPQTGHYNPSAPSSYNNNYNNSAPSSGYSTPATGGYQPPGPGPILPSRPKSVMMNAPSVPRARALYAFAAQEANELSFQQGDIILIHQTQGEWWEGELNGRKGLLPNNYVEMLP